MYLHIDAVTGMPQSVAPIPPARRSRPVSRSLGHTTRSSDGLRLSRRPHRLSECKGMGGQYQRTLFGVLRDSNSSRLITDEIPKVLHASFNRHRSCSGFACFVWI